MEQLLYGHDDINLYRINNGNFKVRWKDSRTKVPNLLKKLLLAAGAKWDILHRGYNFSSNTDQQKIIDIIDLFIVEYNVRPKKTEYIERDDLTNPLYDKNNIELFQVENGDYFIIYNENRYVIDQNVRYKFRKLLTELNAKMSPTFVGYVISKDTDEQKIIDVIDKYKKFTGDNSKTEINFKKLNGSSNKFSSLNKIMAQTHVNLKLPIDINRNIASFLEQPEDYTEKLCNMVSENGNKCLEPAEFIKTIRGGIEKIPVDCKKYCQKHCPAVITHLFDNIPLYAEFKDMTIPIFLGESIITFSAINDEGKDVLIDLILNNNIITDIVKGGLATSHYKPKTIGAIIPQRGYPIRDKTNTKWDEHKGEWYYEDSNLYTQHFTKKLDIGVGIAAVTLSELNRYIYNNFPETKENNNEMKQLIGTEGMLSAGIASIYKALPEKEFQLKHDLLYRTLCNFLIGFPNTKITIEIGFIDRNSPLFKGIPEEKFVSFLDKNMKQMRWISSDKWKIEGDKLYLSYVISHLSDDSLTREEELILKGKSIKNK